LTVAGRDRFGGLRARRAVVKTRLVRIGTKGMPAARICATSSGTA
jgi:hypothetical protein